MTLENLTAESFADRKQDRFTLSISAGELDLVLIEVEEFGSHGGSRAAFSLRFRGPALPVLRQAIYRLENPVMGALEIFLVPLGPQDGFMRYEAVFA